MASKMMKLAFVASAAVTAIRVDEEEESQDAVEVSVSQDDELTVRLNTRAAESTGVYSMLEKTVQRKASVAQRSADRKKGRVEKRTQSAEEGLQRELLDVEFAKKKEAQAVKDSTLAEAAGKRAEHYISEEKKLEEEAWREAELWGAKEKRYAELPNKKACAEKADRVKRAAEQEARAAESAQRRLQAQVVHEQVNREKADEETVKYSEEEKAALAAVERKHAEIALLKNTAELADSRLEAETQATAEAKKVEAAEKLVATAAVAEEAARHFNKLDEVKLYTEKRVKAEEKEAAYKATLHKLQAQAAQAREAAATNEEEAKKKSDEALTLEAGAARKMAEREVAYECDRTSAAKKRAEKFATSAAAACEKPEKDGATAEAERAASQAAYSSSNAQIKAAEVKDRRLAERAGLSKVKSQQDAYAQLEKQGALRAKAEHEEEEALQASEAGKLVEKDAHAAAKNRYEQEESAAVAARQHSAEAAIKYQQTEEEFTKKADALALQGADAKRLEHRLPCANEQGICVCKGTVIYGRRFMDGNEGTERSLEQTLAHPVRTRPCGSSLICDDVVFGDPAPGYKKHCFCQRETDEIQAVDDAHEASFLAEEAERRTRALEAMYHKERNDVDDMVISEEQNAEKTLDEADQANRELLKKVRKAENEAARIKVEHGVGEVGYDDMDHHDMLG